MACDGIPLTNFAAVRVWVLKGALRSFMDCRQSDTQLPWRHDFVAHFYNQKCKIGKDGAKQKETKSADMFCWCSAKEAEAAEKDLRAKQREHDWLQSQLGVLQQEMQDQLAKVEEQRQAAAAAKEAEHSHGLLYHKYLKQALVLIF